MDGGKQHNICLPGIILEILKIINYKHISAGLVLSMFPLHDRVSVDGSYSFSAQHELSSLLWCDAGYAPGVRSTQPVVVGGVIFKTHFLLDSFWLGSWQWTEICVCHLKNGGKLSETVYGFGERLFFLGLNRLKTSPTSTRGCSVNLRSDLSLPVAVMGMSLPTGQGNN